MSVMLGCADAVLFALGGRVLLAAGQEPDVARSTGAYLLTLIPMPFCGGMRGSSQSYATVSGYASPFTVNAIVTAATSIPLAWLLVQKTGYIGGGIALSVRNLINTALDLGYIALFMPTKSAARFDVRRAMRHFLPLVSLALPSVVMSSEIWAAEAVVLMSGRLADRSDEAANELDLACMSLFQNMTFLQLSTISGFQTAIASRVATMLGAKRPAAARRTAAVGTLVRRPPTVEPAAPSAVRRPAPSSDPPRPRTLIRFPSARSRPPCSSRCSACSSAATSPGGSAATRSSWSGSRTSYRPWLRTARCRGSRCR